MNLGENTYFQPDVIFPKIAKSQVLESTTVVGYYFYEVFFTRPSGESFSSVVA